MELLMFIGTVYAVLYVLWLLVIVVSGMPERWINTTLFFVMAPFVCTMVCAIVLVTMFVAPFIYFFSAKARQDFRDRMRESGVI